MSDWVRVAADGDIPDGGCLQVEVGGEPVALFNVAGKIRAIHNTCAHRGGPLSEGDVNGDLVTCPWHGWQYDVTSGECRTNPAVSVKKYEAKVENGEILVQS